MTLFLVLVVVLFLAKAVIGGVALILGALAFLGSRRSGQGVEEFRLHDPQDYTDQSGVEDFLDIEEF